MEFRLIVYIFDFFCPHALVLLLLIGHKRMSAKRETMLGGVVGYRRRLDTKEWVLFNYYWQRKEERGAKEEHCKFQFPDTWPKNTTDRF